MITAPASPTNNPMASCTKVLAHEEPHHLRSAGAERDTNADLLRPLCHAMRGDRVQADRSQEQRDAGQEREHETKHAVRPA